MKKALKGFLFFLTLTIIAIINGCDSPPPADIYNLQKKYWDATDYENAITSFKDIPPTEKLPCYAFPDKKPIFIKLVDANNFKVVMDDEVLGINHRKEYAQRMFSNYQELVKIYRVLDAQDKFVYPRELAEIMVFGMEFQIDYFKLGNEGIKKDADDPKSADVLDVIQRNEQSLVSNFTMDLEYAKRENAFSDEALVVYTTGVDKFFKQLITEFPNSDYSEMLSTAKLMQGKVEKPIMKTTLANLITLLETKTNSKKSTT